MMQRRRFLGCAFAAATVTTTGCLDRFEQTPTEGHLCDVLVTNRVSEQIALEIEITEGGSHVFEEVVHLSAYDQDQGSLPGYAIPDEELPERAGKYVVSMSIVDGESAELAVEAVETEHINVFARITSPTDAAEPTVSIDPGVAKPDRCPSDAPSS